MKWLLLMDLDGTLWDHKDVSSTHPPFTKINDLTIRDKVGEIITVNEGAIDFLQWARANDAVISSLSWNNEDMATEAINALGLVDIFDFLAIAPNPDKSKLLENLLAKLRTNEVDIEQSRFVYLDDRDIHIGAIVKKFPDIIFVHMWESVSNFEQVKRIIQDKLDGIDQ